MDSKKGYINILVIVVVLFIVSVAAYFSFFKQFSKPFPTTTEEISKLISKPENQMVKEGILQEEEQEGRKAKSQIDSLSLRLQEALKIEPGDTTLLVTAIKKYEIGFNSYVETVDKLNIEKIDENLLKSIRLAEWQNYRIYLTLKERFNTNTVALQSIITTQKILERYIKDQSVKALSRIVINSDKNKKSSSLFPYLVGRVEEAIIRIAEAQEQKKNVIHKKVILDPDDPGKSGKNLICWGYESWVDLETGDIRQEQNVTSGNKCKTEIDITEGATGRKLALNPVDKLAEWIVSPKTGIGDEIKKDPYSDFKDKLEKGEYILLGTDTFNGQEVYVLKRPVYQLDHEIIYLDAVSYLPVRSLSYIEEVIIETIPGDSTKSNIIRTGKLINNFGLRYVVGELIERETLPSDFFELKIPEGYELKMWVPGG